MDGQITAASSERPTLVVYRDDIYLDNTGSTLVCLDAVELGEPPPPATVPVLLGSYVATRQRDFTAIQLRRYGTPGGVQPTPLQGYALRPHLSIAAQPAIVLKLRAGDAAVSYNQYVVLAYHDLSGQRYAVVFPMRYLMCVKGRSPPDCEQHEPP